MAFEKTVWASPRQTPKPIISTAAASKTHWISPFLCFIVFLLSL